MDLILQIWGGSFYLLNKILFALSEGNHGKTQKHLRVSAWSIYILGVPAWVIILIGHQDWIAASIEAGGVPAMVLGLYNTYHDHQRPHKAFNILVTLCTYSSLAFGLLYSLVIHGGIASISQVLEVGVMLGFLMGSYLMARNNPNGWLFFMLMNLSMASLMFVQEKPILLAQQLLSLCFAVYGFSKARQRNKRLQLAITAS